MNAAPPTTLLVRLRCRSCPNQLASAFACEHPTTAQPTPEFLIGGRWVSDVPPPALSRSAVVCLDCGAADPEADVFEVPANAADAERNRHLIVAALDEALRLSERARPRAAGEPIGNVGPEIAPGQLRNIHERITALLAEGAERGFFQQALRAAHDRIGKLYEQARRDCRKLARRTPSGHPAGKRP